MAEKVDIGDLNSPGGPIFGGTNVTFQFTLTSPRNVSGWTVRLYIKQQATDTTALLTKTPTAIDVVNGIWTQTLTKADTLFLTNSPGTYVYSFERIDNGAEDVLTYGKLQITRKVGPS